MSFSDYYKSLFSQEYVMHYTDVLPWGLSYDLVRVVHEGNWKNSDSPPLTFVCTLRGTEKMYSSSVEALLDDCMEDGRWHI